MPKTKYEFTLNIIDFKQFNNKKVDIIELEKKLNIDEYSQHEIDNVLKSPFIRNSLYGSIHTIGNFDTINSYNKYKMKYIDFVPNTQETQIVYSYSDARNIYNGDEYGNGKIIMKDGSVKKGKFDLSK